MGHVESVDIEGFKCLKSVSLECGQFNLITGRNGTGKSSVLEAIELAHDPKAVKMWSNQVAKVVNREQDSGSVQLQRPDQDLQVRLRQAEEGRILRRATEILASKIKIWKVEPVEITTSSGKEYIQDRITVTDEYDSLEEYISPEFLKQRLGQIYDCSIVISRNDVDSHYIYLDNWAVSDAVEVNRLRDNLPEDHQVGWGEMDTEKDSFSVDFPSIDISKIEPEVFGDAPQTKINDLKSVRVRDFLREHDIFPNLESFSFDELVFDEDGEQYAIPYDFLGDGTKTIIGIVWQLVADDEIPDVVLLEEPENHLHPGYVKELVPFLIDFAREEDVQLFVTSHNVDFISELLSDSLSEDHREWLAEEFRLIQMTELSPKQFDYDRATHHFEELHLDLRGL